LRGSGWHYTAKSRKSEQDDSRNDGDHHEQLNQNGSAYVILFHLSRLNAIDFAEGTKVKIEPRGGNPPHA